MSKKLPILVKKHVKNGKKVNSKTLTKFFPTFHSARWANERRGVVVVVVVVVVVQDRDQHASMSLISISASRK